LSTHIEHGSASFSLLVVVVIAWLLRSAKQLWDDFTAAIGSRPAYVVPVNSFAVPIIEWPQCSV
jgi:hypothetical protein